MVAYYSHDPLSGQAILRAISEHDFAQSFPVIISIEGGNYLGVNNSEEILRIDETETLRVAFNKAYKKGLRFVRVSRVEATENGTATLLPKHATNVCLDSFGCLLIVGREENQLHKAHVLLCAASGLVSRLVLVAIHETERQLRSNLVARSLRRRDLNSFLHGALEAGNSILAFEGASVFLWDSEHRLLRLHATTGMRNPQPRRDTFYHRDEERITVGVALTGIASVTDSIGRDHAVPGKHEERVPSPRTSFAALPILDYGRASEPDIVTPLGVLRVINNKTNILPSTPIPFAWDDLYLLRFLAELIGVVTNHLRRGQEEQDHFERIIHGIKANIGAVQLNMSLLESRPDAVTVNISDYHYIIPDCLALINDIKWQVERNLAWYRCSYDTDDPEGHLTIQPTLVMGDVLAKIKGLVQQMATANNAGSIVCEYDNYEEFKRLPPVDADPGALATVFRNLIENALKYTRMGAKDSRITFRSRKTPGFLEILVEDNGIGVPKNEENWIFIDGYRSDNAMRRRPAGGSGIGLPQSRDLMTAMKGDVYYERVPNVTRFVVRLKLHEEKMA